MLKDIRGSVGNERIYLFLDNASFHKVFNEEEVKKLNIEPIFNVPYHFQFNDAVEKYWSYLKSRYKPILLKKMLYCKHFIRFRMFGNAGNIDYLEYCRYLEYSKHLKYFTMVKYF